MTSSKELIRKRSEYYAFKERVNILKSELKSSLSAISLASSKANETYTLDGEQMDHYKLKEIQRALENHYNVISTRTLPAIDYKISRLSNEIEQAIADEIAAAKI